MNPIHYLQNKLTAYLAKQTRWGLMSDALFVVFLVLMIVPSTRLEILPRIQRLLLLSPSAVEADKQVILSDSAYLYPYLDAQGQPHSLAEHRGRVVFLNLWATWCPPCIAEIPSIERLQADYAGRVDFLLLTDESPEVVKAFQQKRSFDFNFQQLIHTLPSDLYTQSYPTTYIVGKKGNIALRRIGTAKWDSQEVRQLLDRLLAE